MEQPVRFTHDGIELFGMLHFPDTRLARAGIILSNSRVEYRVGPHRFYVRFARRCADAGFAVLRFDHPGNGDSGGDTVYRDMDAFPVEPVLSAAAVLRERIGTERIVIAGLCMGARNALYAAARDESVRHFLGFGMPFSDVTPDLGRGDADRPARAVGSRVARSWLRGYLRRSLQPSAWLRLIRGRSDFDVMRRILPAAFGWSRNAIYEEPVFHSLSKLLARDGSALFVSGRNDVFLPDFLEHYDRIRSRIPADRVRIDLIDDANHTFSRVEWQERAISAATDWLSTSLDAT